MQEHEVWSDGHSAENRGNHQIPGILVVDDDDAIRELLELALNHMGYRVTVASNLSDAIAIYHLIHDDCEIALLDFAMPGGNGIEVLKAFRVVNPVLPVVLMSGDLDRSLTNSLAERLRSQGATRLIAKPMKLSELQLILKEALVDPVEIKNAQLSR